MLYNSTILVVSVVGVGAFRRYGQSISWIDLYLKSFWLGISNIRCQYSLLRLGGKNGLVCISNSVCTILMNSTNLAKCYTRVEKVNVWLQQRSYLLLLYLTQNKIFCTRAHGHYSIKLHYRFCFIYIKHRPLLLFVIYGIILRQVNLWTEWCLQFVLDTAAL